MDNEKEYQDHTGDYFGKFVLINEHHFTNKEEKQPEMQPITIESLKKAFAERDELEKRNCQTVKTKKMNTDKIPFNIDAWNTGKYEAVYRNGMNAKMLCVDGYEELHPIVTMEISGITLSHLTDGKYYNDRNHNFDLFLIPKTEEVTGWINMYADTLFPNREMADNYAKAGRIDCIQITHKRQVK